MEDVEANMFRVKTSRYSLVARLQRLVQMPTKLIGIGLGAKLRWAGTWAMIALAFFAANAWLVQSGVRLELLFRETLQWVCIIVPLFLVLFPTPSAYAFSGFSEPDIAFAIGNLCDRGLVTEKRLATAQQHIKMLETYCGSRVRTHKWLVGISWAIWTFMLLKGFDSAFAGKLALPGDLFLMAAGFIVVAGIYLLAAGYESALNRVFRSLETACAELLLRLQEEAEDENVDKEPVQRAPRRLPG